MVVEENEEQIGGGCILGVWDTVDGGIFVPVSGMNVVVLRLILDRSGTEPPEGAGKMGASGKDFGMGRVR